MFRHALVRVTSLCSLGVLGAAIGLAGCQHDVTTLFPTGLEPFDDDGSAAAIPAPMAEALVMTDVEGSDNVTRVYGHGYLFASTADVWAAAQDPNNLLALCTTDKQSITANDEVGYQLDFLAHYEVDDVLTVQWDDQYRGDVISVGLGADQENGSGGPGDVISRAFIKHQKVMGSSFIRVSEGSTDMIANLDDSATEMQMVEHLAGVEAPADQVREGMQFEFDSLLAAVHGQPAPTCP